jgi:hypothetical protein
VGIDRPLPSQARPPRLTAEGVHQPLLGDGNRAVCRGNVEAEGGEEATAPLVGGVGEEALHRRAEAPVLREAGSWVVHRLGLPGAAPEGLDVDAGVGHHPLRLARHQPRSEGEEVGELLDVELGAGVEAGTYLGTYPRP